MAYESLLINPGYVHITDKSTSWVNRVSEELGEKGISIPLVDMVYGHIARWRIVLSKLTIYITN